MNQVSYTVSSPASAMDDIEDIIVATYDSNVLVISDRTHSRFISLNIDKLLGVDKIAFKVRLKQNEMNKILLVQELPATDEILIVYSNKHSLSCLRKANKGNHPLKQFVKVKFKILNLYVSKNKVALTYVAFISNPYNLNISNTRIYLDDNNVLPVEIPVGKSFVKSKLKLLSLVKIAKFGMPSLLKGGEPPINSQVKMALDIDGDTAVYPSQTLKIHKQKNRRLYSVPVSTCYTENFAVHFRRTYNGTPTLVRRQKNAIEDDFKFRLFESRPISFLLYHMGRFSRSISDVNHNIYFEKYACKAEEGAYNLFCKTTNSKNSKNYYVIDEESDDYADIKHNDKVLKKYSYSYYWHLFRANYFISTEAPAHVNLLRSNNKYVRRKLITTPFVFLQHGITYLKNHDRKGVYAKNREAEPAYMVVSSEKEKKVVSEMLRLPEDRLLNVGMPAFDDVEYSSINDLTDDVVTIMLTWKPYEEHLNDFTATSYYRNTVAVAHLLKAKLPALNIRVVAHPKVYDALCRTDLKDQLWVGKISDALKDTKLLITDYSSVCYNSFYRGAGVIFFQPDIVDYERETGPLVPQEHEYIGYRSYSIEGLNEIIDSAISNNKINLSYVRTTEHEFRYKEINQFSDGNNIDRLFSALTSLKII
ncbi:CDP-glycerol glycerophosphotransferase family protein [Cobetia sp. 5-25-4-2]|uniref:CDP-glycerol glycerophosphotransferase family protein n=1 Tax=Cobetia sp. 5-25-4-2 TaxID=2737459 RepID=UPI0015965E74|nr:CDP-glycerol glycerophosphotransferase family protein [Cobetia sp. 5-25-4-2]